MRTDLPMIGLVLCLAAAGCGNDNDTACVDADCTAPPEDQCLDDTTLRVYQETGSCDPDTDACVYGYTDRACDHGCSDGRCLEADPCDGVVCDEPPGNECVDASTLRVFDAVGTCDPDTGQCSYGHTDRACENGCEEGRCIGQDLCEGVVCDQPPASGCLDESTYEEYEPEGGCDPDTGRCNYPRSEQDCPDGCVHDTCLDLEGDRALLIPEGTRVCSDKRSTWDVFGGYQNRMRITFRNGVVRLPAQPATFERDWIDTVEYGPDRTLLEPVGAGSFTRSETAERVEYRFVQPFELGGESATLTYDVWFDATDPDDRLRLFDETYLSPPREYPAQTIQLQIARGEYERWWFLTCRYLLYQPVLHRVATEDGAALELEERFFSNQDCMLACPTALRQAVFALGDAERTVSDPFRLAFVDGQHNWFDQFLVVFDEPVDDIHGFYYFPNDNQVPEPQVVYLDAGLEEIRTTLVTNHHTVELWPAFDAADLQVESCEAYCRDWLGLAEGCEATCPVEDQFVPGRCLASPDPAPGQAWTPLSNCQENFEACRQAGRPYIQCCCSRLAEIF